jgi:hypothetical protein
MARPIETNLESHSVEPEEEVHEDDEYDVDHEDRECEEEEEDNEEVESLDDTENQVVIRAKWMFDKAETLDDVIECLYAEIEYYKQLQKDGWELIGPVEDDYGFLEKTNVSTQESATIC